MKSVVGALLCSTVAMPAELPVRTVVLYKHGVGYFERQGTLAAGESARLDFKAGEMNDVLKSLTIVDQGGRVTGLRYDSDIPLDRKLSDFPFRIQDGQPLSAVIDQLKGARIEMEFGPQKVAGEVVAARVIPGDKDHQEREQMTLLMDSGELRNVDLAAASSIRFTDPKLQTQFRDYLTVLTDARSKDRRSVYIDSADAKSREVTAEYIAPMPAWKSSYRLMLENSGQGTLEGWAIVDNTTGEDWTNVHVSLVSGKPISFISQLYPPKYIARPDAELPEDKAVAPGVYSGAIGGIAGAGIAPSAPGRAFNGRSNQELASLLPMQSSSIMPEIAAQEIADLFEYTIASPVTVKKDESAMLPFLQQKIAARKLIVYSGTSRPNPMSAAELTNSTGKTLDGGPITVFDAGAYAGEALVETIKSGDKRLIDYGVDLGTRIGTKLGSHTTDVRELHAHHGAITLKSATVEKRVYSVTNIDPRAKTLIIEYPIRAGWDLVDTAKPSETARDVYRFEVNVPSKGSLDFPVSAEHVIDQEVGVSSVTQESLLSYIQNRNLTEAGRRQLQQIADTKTQIAAARTQKDSFGAQIQALAGDEQRNRQNIQSLSNVSGQQQMVQDYARKLSDQETQLGKLSDQQHAVEQKITQLQTQLDQQIERLDF